MGIPVIRKLISLKVVAMLLLVFAGQVTASTAIYCEMMDSASAQMSDHSGHDMSGHQSHSSEQSDGNCCDSFGDCSMSGCVPIAFITTAETNDLRVVVTTIITHSRYIPIQTTNSLYRPPILS